MGSSRYFFRIKGLIFIGGTVTQRSWKTSNARIVGVRLGGVLLSVYTEERGRLELEERPSLI